jgi:hypothetical protein
MPENIKGGCYLKVTLGHRDLSEEIERLKK